MGCDSHHCQCDDEPEKGTHDHEHDGGHEHGEDPARVRSAAAPGVERVRLSIPALCCDSEAALIRKRLGRVEGIDDLTVNIVSRRIDVWPGDPSLTADTFIEALGEVGLDAFVMSDKSAPSADAPASFSLPLALSASLLVVSLASYWLEPLRYAALGAVALGIGPILRRAIGALRSRLFDMNVLMVLAIGGAVFLGEWIEGAAVVVLFGLSLWLEDRSMARARRALSEVAGVVPETAVRAADGAVIEAGEVALGDRLAVRSGDRVPVDGVVLTGRSALDESALTGESMPVSKGPGDPVSAGTVNGSGYLVMEATALAADSAIARLVRLVEEAQAARSPTERFVDRFARIYTPTVIVLAALLAVVPPLFFGGVWATWVYRSLVLLVVACPCALVIATPVAVVSALARAAREGVLIKGGVHLEALGRIRALALDKTGTLTRGRFEVSDCVPLNGYSVAELHELVALAEHASSHPLAEALIEHAGRPDPGVIEEQITYRVVEGEGIEVDVGDRRLHIGNHRMADRLGWCDDEEHGHFERWQEQGWTVLYAGVDGKLAGLHGLADAPRPEAAAAVADLEALGLHLAMLTGDNAGSAEAVRKQLGLNEVRAELLPEDKVRAIADLRSVYGGVGMVGDGINDAPALAAADVGVAMGVRGTAVAMETADVALMSDDLSRLPAVVALGRRSLRVIRNNIVFALAVKATVLTLAALGIANLWMAVGADVGATLAVVAYSLTLLKGEAERPSTLPERRRGRLEGVA